MASNKPRKTRAGDFGPNGQDTGRDHVYEAAFVQMSRPRSKRGYHMARTFVYGTIGLVLALTLGNLLLSQRNQNNQEVLDSRLETVYNPSFKVRFADLGKATISSWYAATPPPLNLAEAMEWPQDGYQPEPGIAPTPVVRETEASQPTFSIQGLSFIYGKQLQTLDTNLYQEQLTYYALVNGQPMNIEVTIGIRSLDNFEQVPVLLSTPTFLPAKIVGNVEGAVSQPEEGVVDLDVTDSDEEQLASWAQAWTVDDRATLKRFTNSNADVTYPGLYGGWEYVDDSFTVVWSGELTDDDRQVASVSWQIKVPDATTEGGDQTTTVVGQTQTQTMDLLVSNLGSGTPRVLAWGPVGSYLDLQAGDNAVKGDAQEALPEPVLTDSEGVTE